MAKLSSIAEIKTSKELYVVILSSKNKIREIAFSTKESAFKYAKKRKTFWCIANMRNREMYDINGNVIYKNR